MYKYQNVSEVTQTITADGDIRPRVVEAGKELVSDKPIENPNLKFLGEDQPDNKVVGTVEKNNVVTDAQPVPDKPEETK